MGNITIPVWRIFLAGRVRYRRHKKQKHREDSPGSPSQGTERILLLSPASPGSFLPIKATLCLCNRRWQGELRGSRMDTFRSCLQPDTHPRHTETLFPLQCSQSYNGGMAQDMGSATCCAMVTATTQHPPTRAEQKCKRPNSHYALKILLQSATRSWIS